MNPFIYNFNMDAGTSEFSTASNSPQTCNTGASTSGEDSNYDRGHTSLLSPTTPPFSVASGSGAMGQWGIGASTNTGFGNEASTSEGFGNGASTSSGYGNGASTSAGYGNGASASMGFGNVASTSTTFVSGSSGNRPPVHELMSTPAQQDTDCASNIDVDEILYNIRMNSSDISFDNNETMPNYYHGGTNNPAESVASSSLIWSDNASNATRNYEVMDTFGFLIKSLSSANNYISSLSREQLSVLRSIRPSLLFEFLQEVARVRSDRRVRRALPHECAFCKNNGENEECYSSHALKDFRGRVLCPVLRAFCCPRCGATGDRAHTIKYCPENIETGSDSSIGSRRRAPTPNGLVVGGGPTHRTNCTPVRHVPTPPPLPSYSETCWTSVSLK